ncbi:hypothetical protein [Rhizobium sp. FY34]|uniref:hypothetical protein n=1 Tax=Rhizobium sp. FY34 TaxID=2562309 RepID=UPI0010C13D01|nr:hypothetical protein [Rhizobium sp. FY34]
MTNQTQTPPPVKSSEPCASRPVLSKQKKRRDILAIKLFCGTEKGSEGKALEQNRAIASDATGILDLFGHDAENHSAKSKKQPEIRENACSWCGAPFSQSLRWGRPLRFCSDPCRHASKADQVREWRSAHAGKPAAGLITCRACRRDFSPPPRSTGRAPHWCSHACKLASLRKPADRPATPDLFTQTERINDD